MDQATHFISGIIQGRYFASKLNLSRVLPISIIAALIPDVDIVTLLLGQREYVIHHRSLSHGIFLSFIWAFLVVISIMKMKERSLKAFLRLLFVAFICVLGHLYLDLMTSYGTSLLSPITKSRYALDAMFIVDPVYWGILLTAYLVLVVKKINRRVIYTVLFIIWFVYPLACLGTKVYVEHKIQQRYVQYKVSVIPDLFAPFRWKVVIKDEDDLRLSVYNSITRKEILIKIFKEFKTPNPAYELEKDKFLRFYIYEFLRFPVEEYEAGYSTVYDLRFYPTFDFFNHLRKNSPFTLTIGKDSAGKILWYEFGGSRQYLSSLY